MHFALPRRSSLRRPSSARSEIALSLAARPTSSLSPAPRAKRPSTSSLRPSNTATQEFDSYLRGSFLLEKDGQFALPTLPSSQQFLNANRILDGLFLGNRDAAQDLDFLTSVQCSYVINCCGHIVPNLFSRLGVHYLTFRWPDSSTGGTVFDEKGRVARKIYRFIQNAASSGSSVLVHGVDGESRSCCAVAVYLMLKFGWSPRKALECVCFDSMYISFRRPTIRPKTYLVAQLVKLSRLLGPKVRESDHLDTESRWLTRSRSNDVEELTARNTFLNEHTILIPNGEADEVRSKSDDFFGDLEARSNGRRVTFNTSVQFAPNDLEHQSVPPILTSSRSTGSILKVKHCKWYRCRVGERSKNQESQQSTSSSSSVSHEELERDLDTVKAEEAASTSTSTTPTQEKLKSAVKRRSSFRRRHSYDTMDTSTSVGSVGVVVHRPKRPQSASSRRERSKTTSSFAAPRPSKLSSSGPQSLFLRNVNRSSSSASSSDRLRLRTPPNRRSSSGPRPNVKMSYISLGTHDLSDSRPDRDRSEPSFRRPRRPKFGLSGRGRL